jgi:hypothetical protein
MGIGYFPHLPNANSKVSGLIMQWLIPPKFFQMQQLWIMQLFETLKSSTESTKSKPPKSDYFAIVSTLCSYWSHQFYLTLCTPKFT